MEQFLTEAAVQAAAAVLLVQTILRLKVVPLAFANRHPVPTNIVLSLIATIGIVRPALVFTNWVDLVLQVAVIAVISALTYNQLLGRSKELQAVSGESDRKQPVR